MYVSQIKLKEIPGTFSLLKLYLSLIIVFYQSSVK